MYAIEKDIIKAVSVTKRYNYVEYYVIKIYNKDIVVLYNLYATNTYRHTGPNHFVS